MVLTCLTTVKITQKPNKDFPNRSKVYTMPFVTEYHSESSWSNLTAKGKIIFPKNVWATDEGGNKVNLGGGIGGGSNNLPIIAPYGNTSPILMRGDGIEIEAGYGYFDSNGNPKVVKNKIPCNWVTKVYNKLPIEVEFEDNMYLLKQTQAPNKNWGSLTMEQIIAELIPLVNNQFGTNLTYDNSIGASTNLGNFRTQNETIAEVLNRLQKDYKIESFFINDTLYSGLITYYPNNTNNHQFVFEKNIIEDKMNYTRLDDIKLGIKAYSVNVSGTQTRTKDGRYKTQKKRMEAFVGTSNANDGQVRTMFFWDVKSEDDLKQKATDALNRIYYEGYRGTFTTFGLPFVKQGDTVEISSTRLPERKGKYFVKSVHYSGGFNIGLRQDIELDFRVDGILTDAQRQKGI